MKLAAWVPTLPELGRETLILIGGALLAAAILHNWPRGRAYIKSAWQ